MSVLFVCSGNICRSPMAAEYFRRKAAEAGLDDVTVDSAGTLGIEDSPASDEAVRAMAEIGVDLTSHRSKGLRAAHVATADLVVGMEAGHLEYLARKHEEGRDRRLLLRAFEKSPRPDPDPYDLEDPIGRPLEFYRQQVGLIRRCVDNLVLHLKQG